jgi:hypothetical protein
VCALRCSLRSYKMQIDRLKELEKKVPRSTYRVRTPQYLPQARISAVSCAAAVCDM